MGISFSCPFTSYFDLDDSFESIIVDSNNLKNNDESQTPIRAISFKSKESSQTIFQSEDRLKNTEREDQVSIPIDKEIELDMENQILISSTTMVGVKKLPVFNLSNPKHEAAIKLQKVYKSFRTRRKLADCAILIEQSWWKLLDFAELKRSSISFFEIEKNETAVSRWSRARTRAAKVGKGLSKNSRAQKLALQHWLEAIDPRHRYGHNLHFYYANWLDSQSIEPFFYWLDIGEGKEVNLVETCPRSKLQQQCIKYLGPMERMVYEVIVEDGKFRYKQSGELLDTRGEPNESKWIFVLSASMNLYVGQKKKGTFQHSSFLAGGATSAAGRLVVEHGMLKAVWPHSGHYRPTPENFQDFISFLKGNSVDLANVKMDPDEEEEQELSSKSSTVFLRNTSSEEDLPRKERRIAREESDSDDKISDTSTSSEEEKTNTLFEAPSQTSPFHTLRTKLTNLSIPKKNDFSREIISESKYFEFSSPESFGTAHEDIAIDQYLSDEEDEDNQGEGIPKEAILKRINSHKGTNSYQLGKQLSFKWTTGAGPRIGCLRDYPPKLQFRCLEKANLSPRSGGHFRSKSSLEAVLQNRLIGKIDIRKTSYSGELPRTNLGGSQNSPLSKGHR